MVNIATQSITYLLNAINTFLISDPIIYFVGIVIACYVLRLLFNILHLFKKGVQ